MRSVLAWEEFLLGTMSAYLTGAVGLSGNPAKPRAKVTTLSIAQELLIGEGAPFVSWTDRAKFRERAKLWFEGGEPYETALAGFGAYRELRIVRNRIVHDNASSREQHRKLMEKKHSAQQGLGPGSYLARQVGGDSRLNTYVSQLRAAALHIATN